LASSTATPIATPTSSVVPAPPTAAGTDFAAPGGGDGVGAPPTGIIVSPHPAPPMPRPTTP
jgi:hypothetical protein